MNKTINNTSFGILFFIVFLIISIWPIIDSGSIKVWSLLISLLFLFLGIINSKILTPLKIRCLKLSEFLGKVIAPIVMGLIYFMIITPIGFLIRLFGKDLLSIKYNKNKSYWIKRTKNIGSMKRQF
jgi:hypothetical protein|tara:strand:- start:6864 stop:7241 length:378 start_codon:yes stop_codon:yes gene_type:complete